MVKDTAMRVKNSPGRITPPDVNGQRLPDLRPDDPDLRRIDALSTIPVPPSRSLHPMPQPTPAAPTHILRAHRAAISALHVSPNNALVYSGDASGWVFVTSTRTLRTITSWQAHTDAILGLEEVGNVLITCVAQ